MINCSELGIYNAVLSMVHYGKEVMSWVCSEINCVRFAQYGV